jgi:cytoskeletal protein RodZ
MTSAGVSKAEELNSRLDPASVRRAKGISLEEIRSSTSISLRFIEAIDVGNFTKLPGGLYSTSYIRQYSKAIGFDESILLERYYDQIKPEPSSEPSPAESATGWKRVPETLRNFFQHLSGTHNQHPA